jgi:ethanolamine utilization microcompartment shell protein EutS
MTKSMEEKVSYSTTCTGADILALGVLPGPKVGFLLKYAADLQLDGIVSTKEEALKAVADRIIHPADV